LTLKLAHGENPAIPEFWKDIPSREEPEYHGRHIAHLQSQIESTLALKGLPNYAKYDASIVRGLAYYTGFVWEISDTRGQNRAIAGGGRYDKLIEMFGGPPLPATGFGMGDVVLRNLLEEFNKLPANPAPTPDIFLINALATSDPATQLLAQLRAAKLSAITSYKATKNIGKLLQDASAAGAKLALILAPAEFEKPNGPFLKLKNLATREESEITLPDLPTAIRAALAQSPKV
jgi:histidyl-tRNA synthetase